MGIKKYKDWVAWFDGLRTAAIKAGATSLVTNLGVFTSTNTVSAIGIPGLTGSGENWRTLLIGIFAQFIFHTVLATATYIQANPDAQVVTVSTDTIILTKEQTTKTTPTNTNETTPPNPTP